MVSSTTRALDRLVPSLIYFIAKSVPIKWALASMRDVELACIRHSVFSLEHKFFFNDRFYLSFFVATHGFKESDFDYYSISYLSAHKSRSNVRAGWSVPLLFAIARFFSTKKRLTNLNGEQNDTGNLLVFHWICHFRAIQPFDFQFVATWLFVSKPYAGRPCILVQWSKITECVLHQITCIKAFCIKLRASTRFASNYVHQNVLHQITCIKVSANWG